MTSPTPHSSFDEFWRGYLRAHSKPLTRQIHYTGITIIHIGVIAGIVLLDLGIAAAGIAAGYLVAWAAHFTIQGNKPVMFDSPRAAAWSLVSGLRMYYLWLSGRLQPELKRAGVRAV